MELTREEAIRNYREHWASNAITGVDKDHKGDYLERNGYNGILHNCFLCEFTRQGNYDKKCSECPIEWPITNNKKEVPCVNSYYGDWCEATDPDERKRLAAIIRDLPEKKIEAPKPEPKFKKGDKVFPVSKSNGKSWERWKETNNYNCRFLVENGYLYISEQSNIEHFVLGVSPSSVGDFFLESDLRPYVEPKAEKQPAPQEPRPFKVGDKVKIVNESHGWAGVSYGDIGTIEKISSGGTYELLVKTFSDHKTWSCRAHCIELLPSNLCPTPHTEKYIFNGPATVCTITQDGKHYKGVAKCAPSDTFDEAEGKRIAYERAKAEMEG